MKQQKLVESILTLLWLVNLQIYAKPDSFSFSDLGAKTDERTTPCSIKMIDGFAHLYSSMQRLEGRVDQNGITIITGSKSDDIGSFTMKVRKYGRSGIFSQVSSGILSEDGKLVYLSRPGFVEEFSAGSNGIRQDFVFYSSPLGKGNLQIIIDISNAVASDNANGIRVRLKTGRDLLYSKLQVIDASGRCLDAHMQTLGNTSISLIIDDTNAKYPVRVDPTIGDADWVSISEVPTVNSFIFASVMDHAGNLYIGGDFKSSGKVRSNFIAKWNGIEWSALGQGLDWDVTALCIDSSGNIYAGGWFNHSGTTDIAHIARWNGTSWGPLGSGTNGLVFGLASDKAGNLYAGGAFTDAGGVACNHIAKWNGTSWEPLGTGMNGDVYALALDTAGNLYAAGQFGFAGEVIAMGVARWDGTNWNALGTGMNKVVEALAFDKAGNLFAGGYFDTAGTVAVEHVAKWDGSSWGKIGTSSNYLYLGDHVLTLAFDTAGNLFAGGSFNYMGGVYVSNVAKWNGSSWSAMGSATYPGVNGKVNSITADASGKVFVCGEFSNSGLIRTDYISQWEGTSWNAIGKGLTGGYMHALVHDDFGNLYAGGSFTFQGDSSNHILAKWDGSKWNDIANWEPFLAPSLNGEVAALAYSSGNIFVAVNRKVIRWDGIGWNNVLETNGPVYALAFDENDNLYAGGEFTNANGVNVKNIAKWDGTTLSEVGPGLNRGVFSIAFDATGNLYAGGSFDSAGSIAARKVAMWDGTEWSALGHGIGNESTNYSSCQVSSIAFDTSGNLFVGGTFDSAGNIMATGIAKWDGTSWSALNLGLRGGVNTVVCNKDGNIYAGGTFGTVQNIPYDASSIISVLGIAKWNGVVWSGLGSGVLAENSQIPSPVNSYCVYTIVPDESGKLFVGGRFDVAGDNVSRSVAVWVGDTITQNAPGIPKLIFPNNLDTNILLCPTLKWSAVTGAKTYQVQVSSNSGFSQIVKDSSGIFKKSIAITGLSSNTIYYWRVRAVNSIGYSSWSTVSNFTTVKSSNILVDVGWNMISLNVHPQDTSVSAIFDSVHGLVLVKNIQGQVYWPAYSVNTIGNVGASQGYQIYTGSPDTLRISGTAIDVAATPVYLSKGWNMISYLPQSEMPLATALAGVISQVSIVKNNSGQIYSPDFSINTIGNMLVGQGYKVYMKNAATLIYPSGLPKSLVDVNVLKNFPESKHFLHKLNTGNNMTILAKRVTLNGNNVTDRSEIAAYDEKGNLVGTGAVIHGMTTFPVWGDNTMTRSKDGCITDEKISFKLWDGSKEYPLEFQNVASIAYKEDGFSSLEFSVLTKLATKFSFKNVSPNPFRNQLVLAFDVPVLKGKDMQDVEISVYNLKGCLVHQIVKGKYATGHYRVSWNCSGGTNVMPGSSVYIARMKAGNFDNKVIFFAVK
ncbi:MAG: hypothetical protein GX556_12935 [Fibrobacter sp.]|nr:hypothetical protein [Fibrobacter sp.]